jgi:nicotinamide riboside transporter PnuC
MMEFFNTILFEMGGRPVLLIDLLSALFGLTTVFLAGRNNKYNC